MTAPCCQICGGKSDGQLICNACESGSKPELHPNPYARLDECERRFKALRAVFTLGSSAELCEDSVAHAIREILGDFNDA
jgi:hypothetical protein